MITPTKPIITPPTLFNVNFSEGINTEAIIIAIIDVLVFKIDDYPPVDLC